MKPNIQSATSVCVHGMRVDMLNQCLRYLLSPKSRDLKHLVIRNFLEMRVKPDHLKSKRWKIGKVCIVCKVSNDVIEGMWPGAEEGAQV